jgi:AcrR family transcriptional regulator
MLNWLPVVVNRFATEDWMPRPYSLGKRATPKAETRARIVAAAVRLYLEQGLAGASTLAIAREADVAPGTVRNHFPDRDSLATAVLDQVLVELHPPSPEIFAGIQGIGERIRRLATDLAAFYERSEPWWRAYQREPELISAWSSGIDRYYRDTETLMQAALGPLAMDETAAAVVAAVIGPPTFFGLRGRGLSAAEAVEITVGLTVPWLEERLRSSDPEREA